MLALEPPVVRHEHDQRVLELIRLAQGADQPLDVVVDREQRARPALVVELQLGYLLLAERARARAHVGGLVADVRLVEARRAGQLVALALRGVARRGTGVGTGPSHQRAGHVLAMGGDRGPPDEERLLRPPLLRDQPVGDLAGHVGRVVLGPLGSPVAVGRWSHHADELVQHVREAGVLPLGDLDVGELDELPGEVGVAPRPEAAVDVHHIVVVIVGGDIEQPAPDVEALGNLTVRVERAVAVEPLSDQGGGVARPLQPGRQRVAAPLHPVPAIWVEVAADAVVMCVLTRDEGRASGATEREGVDRVGEARAPRRQQTPDVRHQRHVARRHVVGHHDEDVRPPVLARGGRASLRGGRQDQKRERDEGGRGPPAVLKLQGSC